MNIIISPSATRRGKYDARLEDGRLLGCFETPFFSSARVLQAEGVLPQTELTMRHEHSNTVSMRSTVGEAARLAIVEGDRGLTVTRYRPGPCARPEQAL